MSLELLNATTDRASRLANYRRYVTTSPSKLKLDLTKYTFKGLLGTEYFALKIEDIWGSEFIAKCECTMVDDSEYPLMKILGDEATAVALAGSESDLEAWVIANGSRIDEICNVEVLAVTGTIHVGEGAVHIESSGIIPTTSEGVAAAFQVAVPIDTGDLDRYDTLYVGMRLGFGANKELSTEESDLIGLVTAVISSSADRVLTQERGIGVPMVADGMAVNGPCILKRVLITKGAAGDCVIQDSVNSVNTTTAGVSSYTIDGTNPGQWPFGIAMANGVYVNLTSNQHVTIVYEPV